MRPARRSKAVKVAGRHVTPLVAYASHRRWSAEIHRTGSGGGPTQGWIEHYDAEVDRSGLDELAWITQQRLGDVVIVPERRRRLVDLAVMIDAIMSPPD
jgi:hypothetical protein